MSLLDNKIFNQEVRKVGQIDLSGYPRFYRTDYRISRIQIGKTDCILIETDQSIKLPVVTKMIEVLEEKNGMPCIVSLPQISDYQKKRFSELNIAYFVSPNNFFIPFLGIALLQEKNKTERVKTFSAQAQLLALHILDGSWINLSSTEVANKMQKSLPSVSNYFKEIEAVAPQVIEKQGTKKILIKKDDLLKKELFKLFEPHLVTPVKKSIYIKRDTQAKDSFLSTYPYAGMSALSKKTMIADDSWKTYAITEQKSSRLDKMAKEWTVVAETDSPDILIQIWKYEPIVGEGNVVDEVSLYLSLKDSPQLKDLRGEEALEILLERITK